MDNQSVILHKIRKDKKITIRQAAKLTGKSCGWLSEVENCKQKFIVNPQEFKRIVRCYGAEKELRRYQLWASTQRRSQTKRSWYEGAIYQHLRLKRGLSLVEAASLIGISKSHLSNIEASRRQVDVEFRNKILEAYDYKQSSFHNYTNREERARAIPTELRLKLIMRQLGKDKLEQVLSFARDLHVGA